MFCIKVMEQKLFLMFVILTLTDEVVTMYRVGDDDGISFFNFLRFFCVDLICL